MIDLRVPTKKDIEFLCEHIRMDDLKEQQAWSPLSIYDELCFGREESCPVATLLLNGKVAGMWGVIDTSTGGTLGLKEGGAWLLTTRVVERFPKLFWRASLILLEALLKEWDVLYNYMDVRHSKAIRWGWRLGFQFEEPESCGLNGEDFVKFTITPESFRKRHERRGETCVLLR